MCCDFIFPQSAGFHIKLAFKQWTRSHMCCVLKPTQVYEKVLFFKKKKFDESQKFDSCGVFYLGEDQNDGTDRHRQTRTEDSSAYKGDRGQLASPFVTWPSAQRVSSNSFWTWPPLSRCTFSTQNNLILFLLVRFPFRVTRAPGKQTPSSKIRHFCEVGLFQQVKGVRAKESRIKHSSENPEWSKVSGRVWLM